MNIKINNIKGGYGIMDIIEKQDIRRMAMYGIALLCLSVALTTTAWGQQGGQGGMPRGGMPGMSEGGMQGIQGMPEGGMPEGMPGGMMIPSSADTEYTAAVYIKDGKYLPEESTLSAVSGGSVGDDSASGIKIASDTDDLNGVFVRGSNSEYTLSDAVIELKGDGSNDFVGLGAGAMAEGGGTLILKNVKITTNGVVSCATVASNKGVLKVYDSSLRVNGGTLPDDYEPFIGPGMKEPPAPLGITGNARAHITMDNSESYFYNSTIIAEGWGALSTDSAQGYVYLEANNCDIKVIKSGYGTYADNGCNVVINDSRIDTPTYTGIMGGASKIILNNTDATSDGNSFLIHNVNGGASVMPTLGINGGKITTQESVILVKSANADITLDGAKLKSKSGVLIQSKVNDDADAIKVTEQDVPGIKVALKDMNLKGNIIHEDTDRTMSLVFTGTTLKGLIKGASVSLDSSCKWTATGDSNVTLVGSIDIKKIDALKNVTITAVAGQGCSLEGSYKLESGGTLNIEGI